MAKLGRPRVDAEHRRGASLYTMVTQCEKERFRQLAEMQGMTVSQFLRRLVQSTLAVTK